MASRPKFYLVEASALPEVFLKVVETKRLLSTGEAATVNEATRMTDISRSAFYKYRDSVMPFHNMMIGRILTYQLKLHDEPGVLSGILKTFADYAANILTINQTIPSGGCALVTITAETSGMNNTPDDLLRTLGQCSGVVMAEVLAG
jgi:chorismate mutase